jgi:predicted HTH transcriptional regulator
MKTDITKNKHGGNAQSNAAFEKIEESLNLRQLQVLATIKLAPGWKPETNGATCKEIAERHNRGMNAISGRITELKRMGKIKQIGRRDGCAVYVINEP